MFTLIRLGTATAALAVIFAAPAAATEDEYLDDLQELYTFLPAEPLLSEGYWVCAATNAGVLSPDIAMMVRDDLGVSTDAAMNIVSDAILDLC